MIKFLNLNLSFLAVFAAIFLTGCSDGASSSKRTPNVDVEACRSEVERAVHRSGQSDADAFRAGQSALEACMKRKGH